MAEDFKKVLTDSLKDGQRVGPSDFLFEKFGFATNDVERKILAAHQKQVQKLQFPVVNSASDPDLESMESAPSALQKLPRALPEPGILPRAAESGRSLDALQGIEDEGTPRSPRHFQLWSTYTKTQSFAMKEEDEEDDDLLSGEGIVLVGFGATLDGRRKFELEQERKLIAQTQTSWWVLSPNSPKRIGWDLAGVVILLYDLIMIPMYTAFPLAPNLFLDMMTGITLGFWTLDILACFCVGYYARDGTLVVSLRKIAKQMLGCTAEMLARDLDDFWKRGDLHCLEPRYILSWFPLDVVIVSIDWVIVLALISEEEGKSAGLMRAGKMLRALRESPDMADVSSTSLASCSNPTANQGRDLPGGRRTAGAAGANASRELFALNQLRGQCESQRRRLTQLEKRMEVQLELLCFNTQPLLVQKVTQKSASHSGDIVAGPRQLPATKNDPKHAPPKTNVFFEGDPHMDPWAANKKDSAEIKHTSHETSTNASRTLPGPVSDLFQQQGSRLQALETAVAKIHEDQVKYASATDHKISQVSDQLHTHMGDTKVSMEHLHKEQLSMTQSIAQALQKQDERLASSMDELKFLFLQSRGVKRNNNGELDGQDESLE
eukprot:s2088_g3.t1